jgi:hypothetical protein
MDPKSILGALCNLSSLIWLPKSVQVFLKQTAVFHIIYDFKVSTGLFVTVFTLFRVRTASAFGDFSIVSNFCDYRLYTLDMLDNGVTVFQKCFPRTCALSLSWARHFSFWQKFCKKFSKARFVTSGVQKDDGSSTNVEAVAQASFQVSMVRIVCVGLWICRISSLLSRFHFASQHFLTGGTSFETKFESQFVVHQVRNLSICF